MNQLQIGKGGKLFFIDNLDEEYGLLTLSDKSIALTFTSSPYWNFVEYPNNQSVGCEKSYTKYLDSLETVFRAIEQKTVQGGRFVINASNVKSRRAIERESFVYPIIPDIINRAKKAGFIFFDEIIWFKGEGNAGALNGRPLFGSYPYPPTPKILDSIFENILIFVKGGKREKVPKEIKE